MFDFSHEGKEKERITDQNLYRTMAFANMSLLALVLSSMVSEWQKKWPTNSLTTGE